MDPLSEVLSLLKLHTYMVGGFDNGGEWSVQFRAHEGIKCYALVSGRCWLMVEGVPDAVRLETGDCFLLPRGLPFRLASDLNLPPVDANTLLAIPMNGGIRTWNGGGGCFSVGGYFAFTGSHARILLDELPPIVHIRAESEKAELRWSLERMRQELREQRPGAALVAQQLATTMLVQALRLHLTEGSHSASDPHLVKEWSGGAGWLSALVNEQMKAAITSMHDNPAHCWTLQELAERSGMARSIFALKLKATVGASPMEYLTRWRMLLAGRRLTSSDDTISAIARSLGYQSESAFSKAFRRVMVCSPRQYRRGRSSDPSS
ncbi:MAG: AraC family transcriptional regulator [Acidobacteriota bacterium]|nr:AraC family transcriptional regulator [Acidobacteriota bacterium]